MNDLAVRRPASSDEASQSRPSLEQLKTRAIEALNEAAEHPTPPNLRKKRFSTVTTSSVSLANSLLTPPPAYETAIRTSDSDTPSASPSRQPRHRPRPRSRPASPSPTASDEDPTSDSDDPLNELLRLTSSLLSTSTSILASSSSLHASLSRLLRSDALRPPAASFASSSAAQAATAGARAELELRHELARADGADGRLRAIELEAERRSRGDARALLAARSADEGAPGSPSTRRSSVAWQDRAERGRTLYVTATAGSSTGLEGLGEESDERDEAVPVASSSIGLGAPPRSDPRPRRTPSAAQDLLGRLAAQKSSTERDSAPAGPADSGGADADALSSHSAPASALSTPVRLRVAARQAGSIATTPPALSARASSSSLVPPRALPIPSSMLSSGEATPVALSITPQTPSSSFLPPSTLRPSHRRRTSTALHGSSALAGSLAQQQHGSATTSLASFEALLAGSEAAASPGRATDGARAAGSAASASLRALAGGAEPGKSVGEGERARSVAGGDGGGDAATGGGRDGGARGWWW
ncbi:uncharacterized protein JCM10292_005941 [Rhodotorula paludigena]|uniref:uncharacterized protein n=1 Tax=Rhodotorula paludigena TaxID=86838 RepID=UPI003171870B